MPARSSSAALAGPPHEALGPDAEQPVAVADLRHRGDDRQRRRRKRQGVVAPVLGPRGRNRPYAAGEIDLRPRHAADFLPPTCEDHEQPDNPAVVVVLAAAGVPDLGKLGVAQHPLTRLAALRADRPNHRIRFGDPHLHGPGQQRAQLGPAVRRRVGAVLASDHDQPAGDIAAADLVEPACRAAAGSSCRSNSSASRETSPVGRWSAWRPNIRRPQSAAIRIAAPSLSACGSEPSATCARAVLAAARACSARARYWRRA